MLGFGDKFGDYLVKEGTPIRGRDGCLVLGQKIGSLESVVVRFEVQG